MTQRRIALIQACDRLIIAAINRQRDYERLRASTSDTYDLHASWAEESNENVNRAMEEILTLADPPPVKER